jgi:hypothetical protein
MKVYLFDDGTIESKLLKHDSERNKEIQTEVIKTEYNPKNIANYLPQIPNDATVHFHFCKEDFLKYDIDSQRNKIRSLSPNLSLFFAYEFLNKDVAVSKAQLAGIETEESHTAGISRDFKVEGEIPPDSGMTEQTETKPAKNKKGK